MINLFFTRNIRKVKELILLLHKYTETKVVLSHNEDKILKSMKELNIPIYKELHYNDTKMFDKIVKKHDVNVLFTNSPKERIKVKNIHVVSPGSKASIDLVNNKYPFYQFCEENNIPIAQFVRFDSKEEMVLKMNEFQNKELCIKPSISIFGLGFYKINDIPEGDDVSFKNYLLLEYLPGYEYSIDCLCQDGKLIYHSIRKKLSDTEQTIIYNEDMYKTSKKLVKLLNLNGTINIQFKEDINGNPKVLEINPRISGGFNKGFYDEKTYVEVFFKIISNINIKKNEINSILEKYKSFCKNNTKIIYEELSKSS